MPIRVLKFGGSSVESIDKMKAIAQKVVLKQQAGFQCVVVVSAMGKTTNGLIELAQQASPLPQKRALDLLLSTGEQVSVALFTIVLEEMGCAAIGLTGQQAGIQTQGLHTKNKIESIDPKRIQKHLAQGKVVVVAGFQGINEEGDITTLGRGGSDTTAVALAASLGCDVEIYTDVQGIYGVDPRLYPQARKLDEISYEEMKEMAFLGAKVMEPRSIEIGQRYGVNIYVASAHQDIEGTWIKENSSMEQKSITGITVVNDVVLVQIQGKQLSSKVAAELFKRLALLEVNVDVITQHHFSDGQVQIAFTTSKDDRPQVERLLEALKAEGTELKVDLDLGNVKISVVGEGMRSQSGVAAQVFELFVDQGIEFKLVSTSEISISYTMDQKYKALAVEKLAQTFSV